LSPSLWEKFDKGKVKLISPYTVGGKTIKNGKEMFHLNYEGEEVLVLEGWTSYKELRKLVEANELGEETPIWGIIDPRLVIKK
jgi:hypothetical protein